MVRGSSTGVNVGIGVDPLTLGSTLAMEGVGSTALDIYEPELASWDAQIRFVGPDGSVRHVIADDAGSGNTNNLIIYPGYGGTGNNTVEIEGNEQIGANPAPEAQGSGTYPTWSLSVDGQIVAKEMVVLPTTDTWPDTVFSNTYKLTPLTEVESYVTENHHLPGVPGTAEVVKSGINVGEMNTILLQKVEELTLYTISLEKRLKQLEAK